jgi:hypothetical protein
MVSGFCNYQNVLNHTEGRLKCIVSKTLAAFEIPFLAGFFQTAFILFSFNGHLLQHF